MTLLFLASLFILPFSTAASDSTVVCVPQRCLQGDSNITLGAKLSTSASSIPIHLLPGEYTSTTNPQLLHDALTSSTTLTPSSGFSNASSSSSSSPSNLLLPLELYLQPGITTFTSRLYSGQTSFTALPNSTNNNNNNNNSSSSSSSSTPLVAQSVALSNNVVVITTSSSNRLVLWDSIPDTNHLPPPFNNAQLSLVDIQSTTCSPSCSSSGGTCNSQGQCVCRDGFTGSSCEECSSGRFGPKCQVCVEDDCEKCDEGVSGSGRCLKKKQSGGNDCDCVNGVCGEDGTCQCTTGFTKADNGTQCAKCADGFFLTSGGDCKACQVGCTKCTDGTGDCLSCKSGSTQNQNDRTQCIPPTQITTSGTQCPPLAFANGDTCSPCAASCQTCSGGTSNDCTECVQGQYMLNGVCVKANGDGVCDGTSLIADNNKKACDSCGARCTSCKIPDFSAASIVTQLQCTGCVPGSFLSDGKCVDSCPDGTFVSPQDGVTCQQCDSSCRTCSGSPTFCLSCSSQNQLVFNGTCVAADSCPKSTFASNSASSCISCHPDCSECSDSGFNKCTACPPERPVLTNGRCLSTCSKNEYWDSNANECKTCDSTCGSCIGPGASSCLSCSNANDRVLRSGSCVSSSNACSSLGNDTLVINPLGVCFAELVVVTNTSNLDHPDLNEPTKITTRSAKLEWWQILLMALGCAFIFLVFIWCCCRRGRKKRKEEERRRVQGYAFADVYGSNNKRAWWRSCGRRKKNKEIDAHYHPALDRDGAIRHSGWKYRLIRFGEKFFGHSKSTRGYHTFHSPVEMSTTVGGKSIQVLHDQPASNHDIKHRSPRYSSPHSRSNSDAFSYHDRNVDIERIASSPPQRRMASPPAEPFRPFRSNHEHGLDVRNSHEGYDLDNLNVSSQSQREHTLRHQEEDGEDTDMVQLISQYRYTISPKTPPATKKNSFHHGSRSSSAPHNSRRHSNTSGVHQLGSPPSRSHNHNHETDDIDDYYGQEEYYRRSYSSTISTDSLYSQVTGRTRRTPDARQRVRGDEEQAEFPPILKSKFSMSTIGVSNENLRDRRKLKKKAHQESGSSLSFWK